MYKSTLLPHTYVNTVHLPVTTYKTCGLITGNGASWDTHELGVRVISLVKQEP